MLPWLPQHFLSTDLYLLNIFNTIKIFFIYAVHRNSQVFRVFTGTTNKRQVLMDFIIFVVLFKVELPTLS